MSDKTPITKNRRPQQNALIVTLPDGRNLRFTQRDTPGFGRSGENAIRLTDPNLEEHLNRFIGRFISVADGRWLIENPAEYGDSAGRRYPITVHSNNATVAVNVGTLAPLPTLGRVEVGPRIYGERFEFSFRLDGTPELPTGHGGSVGRQTFALTLTPRALDYLTLLAEPLLLNEVTTTRPTAKQVGESWGVTEEAVHKTLRGAREQLVTAGYCDPPLEGERLNVTALVDLVIQNQLVTTKNIEWVRGSGHLRSHTGPITRP